MRDLLCVKFASACLIGPEADNEPAGGGEPGATAAPDGEAASAYQARGSEPFWSMIIDEQIMFAAADGPDLTVPTPAQQPTRAGYRYVTPEMTVIVNTFAPCTAADGEVYHDTVQVIIGGQNFSGCGGAPVAAG